MKTLKNTLSLLLCLLLLATPLTASAQTYQLTEPELAKLEQVFSELKNNNEILLSDSTKSALALIEVSRQLKQSQTELLALKELLMRLQAESIAARSELSQANSELAKASLSFKAYAKEQDRKINSLRRDRTIWEIVAGLAITGAVYSVIK